MSQTVSSQHPRILFSMNCLLLSLSHGCSNLENLDLMGASVIVQSLISKSRTEVHEVSPTCRLNPFATAARNHSYMLQRHCVHAKTRRFSFEPEPTRVSTETDKNRSTQHCPIVKIFPVSVSIYVFSPSSIGELIFSFSSLLFDSGTTLPDGNDRRLSLPGCPHCSGLDAQSLCSKYKMFQGQKFPVQEYSSLNFSLDVRLSILGCLAYLSRYSGNSRLDAIKGLNPTVTYSIHRSQAMSLLPWQCNQHCTTLTIALCHYTGFKIFAP